MIDSHRQYEIIEVLMTQPIEVREQVEEVSVDIAILNDFLYLSKSVGKFTSM